MSVNFFLLFKRKYRSVFCILHRTLIFNSQRLILSLIFCLCTFFALFQYTILRHHFSVCSDVQKIKDKCRLFLKDYVILCIYVRMCRFSGCPIVCILTVCLKNKHLVKLCKEFVHLLESYDRQIESLNANRSKYLFSFSLHSC
jgi:hypothetical protein